MISITEKDWLEDLLQDTGHETMADDLLMIDGLFKKYPRLNDLIIEFQWADEITSK